MAERPTGAPVLGIHILSYGQAWADVARVATRADELGYDLVLGADHLYATGGDPFEPFFEGWLTLAAWGQLTRRARLGLLVGANPFRHPGIIAKMVATLDHQTGGRAILGLGAAWDQEELDAHGLARGTTLGQRLRALDESLGVIMAILAGETVTHDGTEYRLEGVRHAPGPLQARVPVLVGAAGEKVGLRVVARHADLWQSWAALASTGEFRRKCDVLAEHCAAVGRDPAAITRMPGAKVILRDDPAEAEQAFARAAQERGWTGETLTYVREAAWLTTPDEAVEALQRYRAAGAGGFIAQAFGPYDDETFERLAGEVWPAVQ
jgi:alkanesulfonate monooxygenase SsuD/methylene tetrahydromethanopterin reductase-like flavin-dependent oxidoreductase (luciferase family)